MAKTVREPQRKIELAQGMAWLLRMMNGETVRQVAKALGKKPGTIQKYAAKAADTLLEDVQAKVMADVVPLALAVMQAAMTQQMKRAAADPTFTIDTSLAERILKGMYVSETPQWRSPQAVPPPPSSDQPDPEVETLAAFVTQRRMKPQPVHTGLPEGTTIVEAQTIREEAGHQTDAPPEGGDGGSAYGDSREREG